MNTSENLQQTAQQTAQQIRQQITEQLPVLKQNLLSLQQSDTIATLPLVIHNICIICERQAYKFLKPALQLYQACETSNLNKAISEMVDTTINILSDLCHKEDKLQEEQYQQMYAEKDNAEKNGEEYNMQAEIDVFNHLEADMSSFYKKLIMLSLVGQITFNQRQNELWAQTLTLCIDILETIIRQKQITLENINKFNNEKEH